MSFLIAHEESSLLIEKFLIYRITFLPMSFPISELKVSHFEFKIKDITVILWIVMNLKLSS